jgi:hypothetical protein
LDLTCKVNFALNPSNKISQSVKVQYYQYGKDEAEDLTPDEKKALKTLVNSIKGERQ